MKYVFKIEEKEINPLTNELLERISLMEESVKKSRMIGEKSVLKGINVFKAILVDINPSDINDDMVCLIEDTVATYVREKENEVQAINHYLHYGLRICYSVIESYNMIKNGKYRSRTWKSSPYDFI